MATCLWWRRGLATRRLPSTRRNSSLKELAAISIFLQEVEAFAKARDVQERSGDSPPQLPIAVRGRCAGIVTPFLSCGEGTGLVPESACAPEQKAKLCLCQEMVVGIECHPRACTILQGCDCVLVQLGSVSRGANMEPGKTKPKRHQLSHSSSSLTGPSERPKPC